MIAQARITSDTSATVHLATSTVEVQGADLAEVRDKVKQAFITAARSAGEAVDVVIVEPDVRHHLRVETTGRIAGREEDDRPLFGPGLEDPLLAPADAELPTDDTVDLGSVSDRLLPSGPRDGGSPASTVSSGTASSAVSATSPVTAERAVTGSPANDDLFSSRSHRARRRRTGAGIPGEAGASADSASEHDRSGASASTHSAGSPAIAPARSASSASSAASASSAPGSASAASPAAPPTKRALPPRAVSESTPRPTLQDLQISTARPEKVKATRGFPGFITKLTGGIISPRPSKAEQRDIDRLGRIRRSLEGPRNIAVVNLKGGAHKTTASLMIAATLGVTRGGNVLAWDNNETRGTLGWRGVPTDHHKTAVDLLHDIERLQSAHASNADLDTYVRPQGDMHFDILASDEDPGSAASIDDAAFQELNDTLSRFYRIKVIDTGNNVRASNWLAAVRDADQLVIVSTVREDTFNAAAWMIDELRATGLAQQVDSAVTVLSHSSKGKFDPVLRQRLLAHFGAHTRAVTEVPFEQQFVDGSHLEWSRVSSATKDAWIDATALIMDGL